MGASPILACVVAVVITSHISLFKLFTAHEAMSGIIEIVYICCCLYGFFALFHLLHNHIFNFNIFCQKHPCNPPLCVRKTTGSTMTVPSFWVKHSNSPQMTKGALNFWNDSWIVSSSSEMFICCPSTATQACSMCAFNVFSSLKGFRQWLPVWILSCLFGNVSSHKPAITFEK